MVALSQAMTNCNIVAQRVEVVGGKLLRVLEGEVGESEMAGPSVYTKAGDSSYSRASLCRGESPGLQVCYSCYENPVLSSDDVHWFLSPEESV